jgi:hypothetical protein
MKFYVAIAIVVAALAPALAAAASCRLVNHEAFGSKRVCEYTCGAAVTVGLTAGCPLTVKRKPQHQTRGLARPR